MTFGEYILDVPSLHSWDGGRTWNTGGFTPDDLEALYDLAVSAGRPVSILETGAGNSTITFLLSKPEKLISIEREVAVLRRVGEFCTKNGIDTRSWTERSERSERVLPELAAVGNVHIDLALIDGGHGWPTVFVDFCYVYMMLSRHGILVIDDVQLHSVKELAKLIDRDNERFLKIIDRGKWLAFSKLSDEKFLPEWNSQRYIRERTYCYAKKGSPFAIG